MKEKNGWIIKNGLMSIREFILEWKTWGIQVAFYNWLVCFTKWIIGAKRIQITYKKRG